MILLHLSGGQYQSDHPNGYLPLHNQFLPLQSLLVLHGGYVSACRKQGLNLGLERENFLSKHRASAKIMDNELGRVRRQFF